MEDLRAFCVINATRLGGAVVLFSRLTERVAEISPGGIDEIDGVAAHVTACEKNPIQSVAERL